MSLPSILVVDDDALVVWALEKALSAKHIAVHVAGNGAVARTWLRQTAFDLAFVDINLPDTNGLDLLKEIRHVSPSTKVVMLSCDGTDLNRRRAHEGGAWQFVEKPFELADVARIVHTCLGSLEDRRRAERFVCQLPLRIALLEPRGGDAEMTYADALAVDVATGGLRLVTTYPLRPGQWVKATTSAESEPCARYVRSGAAAEVVWVTPDRERYTAGLRYP